MANPKTITWYDSTGVLTQAAAAGGFSTEMVRKVVAFDGTAGKGQVGTVPLFTVTGAVIFRLIAVCTESLAGAGATISVGTAGTVIAVLPVTTATDLAANELWFDATPTTTMDVLSSCMIDKVIGGGDDILADVLVANITDGTIAFLAFVTPLTSGSGVVAA